MWKNQIFYVPFDYGQYVDLEGRIHNVEDDYSLNSNNETILSFLFRNSTIDPHTGLRYIESDSMMNARYNGYSTALKGLAFIPSISVFLLFGILVWIYGRYPKPTKDNPYGGRLRKRRRKFNARKKWNSFRIWVQGTAPVLTRFRRRRSEMNSRHSNRAARNVNGDSAAGGNKISEIGGGDQVNRRGEVQDSPV